MNQHALLATLAALVLLPAQAADMNKVLRVALNAPETGFDPAKVSDLYSSTVTENIFDPLVTYDSQATFAAFQSFVQNSELNGYQGQIADKNIGKTPWVHKLDFSMRQEVPFVFGGKLELMADVIRKNDIKPN